MAKKRSHKKAVPPIQPENFTIFHAFFEALKDKEKEKRRSRPLLYHLKLRK
ncbi:hypothetical protein KAT42_03845 [Candidatus Bathyarchaeota archaeon]|nr:hypothetical protein [Candidatus Bathyarchaeota archaeon]